MGNTPPAFGTEINILGGLAKKLESINIDEIKELKEQNLKEIYKLSYLQFNANKVKDGLKDADKAYAYRIANPEKVLTKTFDMDNIMSGYRALWGTDLSNLHAKSKSPLKSPFSTKSEKLKNPSISNLAVKMKNYENYAKQRKDACEALDHALEYLINTIGKVQDSLTEATTAYNNTKDIKNVQIPTEKNFEQAIDEIKTLVDRKKYPDGVEQNDQAFTTHINTIIG